MASTICCASAARAWRRSATQPRPGRPTRPSTRGIARDGSSSYKSALTKPKAWMLSGVSSIAPKPSVTSPSLLQVTRVTGVAFVPSSSRKTQSPTAGTPVYGRSTVLRQTSLVGSSFTRRARFSLTDAPYRRLEAGRVAVLAVIRAADEGVAGDEDRLAAAEAVGVRIAHRPVAEPLELGVSLPEPFL